MIKSVSSQINIPLITGGGITSAEKAIENCNAGADIIVVGNAIENENSLISEISKAVHKF
jgi:putative glycerol-1-phosphate prenyltransferase